MTTVAILVLGFVVVAVVFVCALIRYLMQESNDDLLE